MIASCDWNSVDMDNVYMVTTDADLWPIASNVYNLPDGMDVLSLNAYCCGTFKHGTMTYRMLPMSHIGARIATWRSLTYRYILYLLDNLVTRNGKKQTCVNAYDLLIFIARQHTDARYSDINIVILSVRPSVRPSVRDTLVLYENGSTYRHSFFTIR